MPRRHPAMSLASAVTFLLSRRRPQWLIDYELGVILWQACELGCVAGKRLKTPKSALSRRHYIAVRQALLANGVLRPVPGEPCGSAYRLIGAGPIDVEAILCGLDPFAHLSHLSAMKAHGLTDVQPTTLHALTLPTRRWRSEADVLMRRMLGSAADPYRGAEFPWPRQRRVAAVAGRPISWAGRESARHFTWLTPRRVRVTSLGMTFLDMLREPDWCGGAKHVQGVYAAYAHTHLAVILVALERHGSAVDKARAGYMLEEVCGLELPELDRWAKSVQRGGSRRLVPDRPYGSHYSARWCLSLNA